MSTLYPPTYVSTSINYTPPNTSPPPSPSSAAPHQATLAARVEVYRRCFINKKSTDH